jgi:hypothetical protein
MATKFSMTRDINGYNGFGLETSDIKYNAALAATTATTVTAPSSASIGGCMQTTTTKWLMIMTYSTPGQTWVAFNGATAAFPVGTSFAATSSELDPPARTVDSGEVISFITSTAGNSVGIAFYSLS